MIKKRVNEIERERGANASVGMEGNVSPILNLPESRDAVRKSYARLESRMAKREFFNSGLLRIDRDMPRAWSRLYWFLELCRAEKWFWQEEGFDSFEEFWKQRGSFAFEEFRKLEAAFNFAKVACPHIFDMEQDDLDELLQFVARLSKSRRKSSKNGKANGFEFFDLDFDLQSDDFKRGFRQGGGATAVRRFRRLKRLSPRIAREVLEGRFVRMVKGQARPDLAAAEKEAGIYRPEKKPQTAAKRIAARLDALSKREMNEVLTSLDAKARRRLQKLLETS